LNTSHLANASWALPSCPQVAVAVAVGAVLVLQLLLTAPHLASKFNATTVVVASPSL